MMIKHMRRYCIVEWRVCNNILAQSKLCSNCHQKLKCVRIYRKFLSLFQKCKYFCHSDAFISIYACLNYYYKRVTQTFYVHGACNNEKQPYSSFWVLGATHYTQSQNITYSARNQPRSL